MKNMKKAILFFGPPSVGKGTQANLLVQNFGGLVQFDTGRCLEDIFYGKKKLSPLLKKEKVLFDSGKWNSPPFVLKIISDVIKKMGRGGLGMVFSGSPKTMFEAFGDKIHTGIIDLLKKIYGKNDIYIVYLKIPKSDVVTRTLGRKICQVCGLPRLPHSHTDSCIFCGGPLKTRVFDNPEKMKSRLAEYENRTLPIIERLKKEGYKIHYINGRPLPYKVFASVKKALKL